MSGVNIIWLFEIGDVLIEIFLIILVWDNGVGLIFCCEVLVDVNYMFLVK